MENIEDYNNLKKIKPITNNRSNPIIKKKKALSISNDKEIKDLKYRLDRLENTVNKLEKLTKYLDYVRSIGMNRK